MSDSTKRGLFIVFEGLDRCGKTTQVNLLHDHCKSHNIDAFPIDFPLRTTPIGSLIDGYLKNQTTFPDEAIHLLFSANRWEKQKEIEDILNSGKVIICSRYCFSGVAYSAAKGLDYSWCKSPDAGIHRPDILFFLKVSNDETAKREGFGDERYEKLDFQGKVAKYFEKILEDMKKSSPEDTGVFEIECSKEDIPEIHKYIVKIIQEKYTVQKQTSGSIENPILIQILSARTMENEVGSIPNIPPPKPFRFRMSSAWEPQRIPVDKKTNHAENNISIDKENSDPKEGIKENETFNKQIDLKISPSNRKRKISFFTPNSKKLKRMNSPEVIQKSIISPISSKNGIKNEKDKIEDCIPLSIITPHLQNSPQHQKPEKLKILSFEVQSLKSPPAPQTTGNIPEALPSGPSVSTVNYHQHKLRRKKKVSFVPLQAISLTSNAVNDIDKRPGKVSNETIENSSFSSSSSGASNSFQIPHNNNNNPLRLDLQSVIDAPAPGHQNISQNPPNANSSSSNQKLSEKKEQNENYHFASKMLDIPRNPNPIKNETVFVNGRPYVMMNLVGKGGSSKVYRVMGVTQNELYALKKVNLCGDGICDEVVNSFKQEVAYLERLRGFPNIIHLIDSEIVWDENEKSQFLLILTELGETDLDKLLQEQQKQKRQIEMNAQKKKEKGKTKKEQEKEQENADDDLVSSKIMEINRVRYFWQQILSAVKTIHDARIIHGDLKPANFLLVKGTLKLIDFGIARAIPNENMTSIGCDSLAGTINYISPEALTKQQSSGLYKVGRPSDVWSLGCILYQMLFERPPFANIHPLALRAAAICNPNHEINFHSNSNSNLKLQQKTNNNDNNSWGDYGDPEAIDVIKKTLLFDPKQRPTIPELLKHPFLCPWIKKNQ